VIPENVQKKGARDAKLAEARKNDLAQAKKERAEKRKVYTANAEKYAKEYKETEKKLVDAKRAAKVDGGFFVEDEAKVAFVIRTRG
jgi:large subunit ribosomal protein L7e